jgi:hypothetical protein
MNKKLAFLMIAFAWCAAGQGTTASTSKPAEVETKLILLKHASASGVARLLNNAGLPVAGDNLLRAIVVRSTPDKIDQVERIVKQLDAEPQPLLQTEPTNCDLIIYVLGGTKTSPGEGQLSQSLLPVVKQLKAVFPYQSYRLLETLSQRTRVGESTSLAGILPPFEGSNSNIPSKYVLIYTLGSVSSQRGQWIAKVDKFSFNVNSYFRVDNSSFSRDAEVKSSFDVKSGQKVVIGNASVTGDESIFLVVEAKPVE